MNYAGFWRRLGALIVDSIIIGIAIGIVGTLLQAIGIPFFATQSFEATGGDAGLGASAEVELNPVASIISIVLIWLYYALQESGPRGATLGKRVIGIRVVDTAGNRVSFARATGRHFAKYLSALILAIGYIMAAFTAKKQALHDMIAGCLVIKAA